MPSSRTEDAYLLLLLLPVVVVPVFAATIHYNLHQLNFIYYFYLFFGFCKNSRWKITSHLKRESRTHHTYFSCLEGVVINLPSIPSLHYHPNSARKKKCGSGIDFCSWTFNLIYLPMMFCLCSFFFELLLFFWPCNKIS